MKKVFCLKESSETTCKRGTHNISIDAGLLELLTKAVCLLWSSKEEVPIGTFFGAGTRTYTDGNGAGVKASLVPEPIWWKTNNGALEYIPKE